MIKNRKYWPKFINGKFIKLYSDYKEVGSVDSIKGDLDNTPFHICTTKDLYHLMQLMTTYGTNEIIGEEKTRIVSDQRITFKCPELVYNHYRYIHDVGDRNNRQRSPISIERTWATYWWLNRLFAFFLAVTEFNVYLTLVSLFDVKPRILPHRQPPQDDRGVREAEGPEKRLIRA